MLNEKEIIEDYKKGMSGCKIAEKYEMKTHQIYYILKKNGIKSRSNKENSRKYTHNEDFFEVIDTETKAYWLGFMYADGYISIASTGQKVFGISLSIADKEHLERFKKDIQATNPINEYKSTGYGKNSTYCRIAITSDKTVNDLINKGVVEHKTNVLNFPTEKQVPKYLIHHFIRGYFDGDGCITSYKCKGYDRYKTSFVGTYQFLQSVNEIIYERYNIKIPKLFKRKEQHEVYSLEYSSNKRSKILYDFMYKDATIYLNRKYEKFSRLMKK
ncbi:MAG: LAGLIDADG family homing endonuclease [Clostridium sp.]|nr:LAGLIDADG family homing endonuclease [Clostridium sp.]